MNVVARARHVLARRPWLYWAAVLALAATAGSAAVAATAAVDDARRAWGRTRPVLVAVADLAPGDALAGGTEVRRVPEPIVPSAAATDVPAGAVARQHVGAGEIVVAGDVVATAAPQALIPGGWAAVAVAEAVPTGARTGDAVTPVAGGVVVAAEGLVVGRQGEAVLVAVPLEDAPAVAMAASTGELALLLVP